MQLKDLLKDVENYKIIGDDTSFIQSLHYDSRNVTKDSLFFCIRGINLDGHQFALQAIEKGAIALIVDHKLEIFNQITQILVEDCRIAMALIATAFYENPAKKLTMIGVTGTNGKTSITYLIKTIAEQAGKKVGLIGTIQSMIGNVVIPSDRTTPESLDLQKLLSEMVTEKVDCVVMEVSSHSIVLNRIAGIVFDIGIFSNLTQDHLDFHGTLENYLNAKKKLFYQSRQAVINIDDENGRFISKNILIPVCKYGIRECADVNACNIEITIKGVSYELMLLEDKININLCIPGIFSVYNSMAAAAACNILGISLDMIKKGLEALKGIPGRFEIIKIPREYTVILDYAHTPDGLENILKTAKEFAKGRIITLFGCGGDRDRGKRSIMGKVAGMYSDYCIITSDNPRSEDAMSIITQIVEGIKETACEYICIESRREAIRYALKFGKEDDVIILAGKGHETYQIIKGKQYPFDEKEIIVGMIMEMQE